MAKIIGNTTATPNPRPDWNQSDETKADYIKNKPNVGRVFEAINEEGVLILKQSDAMCEKGESGKSPNVGENGNWWVGNEDTGVAAVATIVEGATVVQTTGDSETAVMSQKAVTDEVTSIKSKFIVSEQNLLDVSALKDGYIDTSTGLPKSGVKYSVDKYTDFIPVNPSTDYYRSYCNAFLYKADGTYIDRAGGAPGASKFTTTADTAFVRMAFRSAYEDLTVAFLSSVRSTYAPFKIDVRGLTMPTFGEIITSDSVLNIAFDTENRTLTINGFYVMCEGKRYNFEGGVSTSIPNGNSMYFVVNTDTNDAMVIPVGDVDLAIHIPVFMFFYNFITTPTANTITVPYYVDGVLYNRYDIEEEGVSVEKIITLSAGDDIQAAINDGYTTIILGAGKYPAKAVTIDGANKIKFIVPDATTSNRERKKNAVIDNSIDLEATYADGMLTAPFTANTSSRWYKVFVSKEYTPIRPYLRSESYNAILWETDTANNNNDKKLLPVLTLEECQSTKGSFYYDHTTGTVHINPYDYKETTVYKRLAVEEGSLFIVKNVSELYMENIEVKYGVGVFELTNISECTVRNCVVSHTAWSTGFSINGVNGSFHGCEAYKNCADGFGIGGTLNGYTEYYDCHGHHNYDDGISHHNGSEGAIYGGDWHHNVKGGVAPAHGSVVNCYNVISHDNGYGFYVESDSTVPSAMGRAVKYSGCTAYDNTYGMSVLNYHVVACNCKFEQNTTPTKVMNNSTSSLTIV